MARVAFVMDDIMSGLGLSGRAFLPLLLGFGCSVPAIMASRALEHRRDRFKTILITPFMSCSARLPIYVLFSSMFFGRYAMIVCYSMYLLGIAVAITTAYILSLSISLFYKLRINFHMQMKYHIHQFYHFSLCLHVHIFSYIVKHV